MVYNNKYKCCLKCTHYGIYWSPHYLLNLSHFTFNFSLLHSVPVSWAPLKFCNPIHHVSNSRTWYLPHPWPIMLFPGIAAWLIHFLHTHLSPLTKAFTNDPMKNGHIIPLTLSQFSQHLSSSDILSNYPLILFSISHDENLSSRASRSLFNLLCFFFRG